jgi:hypothetical protein
MKRPWIQKLIIGIGAVIGAILLLGTILDAIGNAISLIVWPIPIYGSISIAVVWVIALWLLPKSPIPWLSGGQIIQIKRLGFTSNCAFIGFIILLWTPAFIDFIKNKLNPIPSTIIDIDNKDQIGKNKTHTLYDLYKTEFNYLLRTNKPYNLSIKRKNDESTIKINSQAYLDFNAGTLFLSFYIPKTPETYGICESLSKGYTYYLDQLHSEINVESSIPGDRPVDLKSLKFSGTR